MLYSKPVIVLLRALNNLFKTVLPKGKKIKVMPIPASGVLSILSGSIVVEPDLLLLVSHLNCDSWTTKCAHFLVLAAWNEYRTAAAPVALGQMTGLFPQILCPHASLSAPSTLPYTKGARLQETYWVTSTTSACPPAGKSERLLYNLQEAQGNS